MADYTVTITLTDNSDPNGPNHFNYAPGLLQVHHGDKVKFSCNRAFTVKFLYGTPFGTVSEFSMDSGGATAFTLVDTAAARQSYHYTVAAKDPGGKIHVDAGCPSIDVI